MDFAGEPSGAGSSFVIQRPRLLQNGRLKRIRVLIFVDQHMAKTPRHGGADLGRVQGLVPVEQEIVVIEQIALGFSLREFLEQILDGGQAVLAPGVMRFQHPGQRNAGVDDARVDAQQSALLRKSHRGLV